MDRRAVIKSMGFLSLHALYPSVLAAFLSGCQAGDARKSAAAFFNEEEMGLIKEVIDLIIPATKTPSASAVNVHLFLDDVFAACLNEEQKTLIKEGVTRLQKSWVSEKDKTAILASLDKEAYSGQESAAWFRTLKQYTMIGFFTSREGTTMAGDYQKIPDKYVGEIKIDEHTLAHSKTSLNFHL